MLTTYGNELASYILSLCPDETVRVETNNLQTMAILIDHNLSFILSSWGYNIIIPGCHVYSIYDWQHRSELIQSMIRHRLGLSTRLQTRSLSVRPVPPSEYNAFMEANHLSGTMPATIIYGLYRKDGMLVSIMSFNKRLTRLGYHWCIVRHANCLGFVLPGGASKLFTHFIRDIDPPLVCTGSDKGSINSSTWYSRFGFNIRKETKPTYRYRNKITGVYVEDRFNLIWTYALDKLGLQSGFDKVWHAGEYYLVWRKNTDLAAE